MEDAKPPVDEAVKEQFVRELTDELFPTDPTAVQVYAYAQGLRVENKRLGNRLEYVEASLGGIGMLGLVLVVGIVILHNRLRQVERLTNR
jgi:hypothetical protein